jgi:hypothetical protein
MVDPFEIPSVLASMGEASITLAGFAAVFKAFGGGRDPDGYSWIRLNIVIEGSLIVAFACYLPSLFFSLDFSDSLSWQLSSLLIVIWAIPRQNTPTFKILLGGRPYPELYFLAGPLGICATLVGLLNLSTLSPISPYSTHLAATLLLLGNVGTIFVAQFRVEHSKDRGSENSS